MTLSGAVALVLRLGAVGAAQAQSTQLDPERVVVILRSFIVFGAASIVAGVRFVSAGRL